MLVAAGGGSGNPCGPPAHQRRPYLRARGVTYTGAMIRWLLVTFLALMLIGWLSPLLRRLGFGRLPGDLRFRWLGREWQIPLASTLLLSLLVGGLAKWL
ncbi:hypothetical protein Veis_1467 [Verminephrobacter eiseniae EF01-2]|uniref:DUF2905 domain-containing protein n=2 Tax=Verminephrobacter eiseniae TaxID=364317 RepID=A1WHX0_VEREI|nr:hypothetical protein Veis_1467 [Verminephrobacter eiseniae EF01-2]